MKHFYHKSTGNSGYLAQIIKTVLLASSLMLTACSSLPENHSTLASEQLQNTLSNYQQWQNAQQHSDTEQTVGQNFIDKKDQEKITRLDDLIQIPQLTTLLETGLQNNPSLQQTLLSLRIVQAQKTQTSANQLPQASIGLKSNKTENSDTLYSSSLDISWEVDLWQKLNDQSKTAEFDILASSALVQASKDALAASIMRTWLQASYQQQLIEIEQQRLALLQSNEDLIKQRYRKGLGSLEELDSARSSTFSTLATIAEYQETLAQNKRTLWQLLGKPNSKQELAIASEFPQVFIPLATLPELDLARRPDLKQQYANIQSAQLNTNIAYKDLLPSFSLQASLSDSDTSLSDALLSSSVWSFLSQITYPLFEGGKLKAAHQIAQYKQEQAYWLYQEILLTAIKETEDALGMERSLTKRLSHTTEALHTSENNAEFYLNRYRNGLVSILDLLNIQQQTFNFKAQQLQITYLRLSNRIDLGLALGLGV